MRDSSTNGHHGQLFGQATNVQEALPTTRLYGKITDPTGTPVSGARIEVHQQGRETSSTIADISGDYELMVPERCDLFVTTGKLSAYKLGFEAATESRQELNWTLAEMQGVARDTLVTPQRAEGSLPGGFLGSTNRVLSLDGKNSYVELPSNIYADLQEATVEGWVEWDTLGRYSRFFDFGLRWNDMLVSHEPDSTILYLEIIPKLNGLRMKAPPLDDTRWTPSSARALRRGQWSHIAAVSGLGGMKLYYNGALAGTNAYAGSFSVLPPSTWARS